MCYKLGIMMSEGLPKDRGRKSGKTEVNRKLVGTE